MKKHYRIAVSRYYMEKLDSALQPDHTAGIHDPVKARKTLTRCCSIPQQLTSQTAKLGSCVGQQSAPGDEEPALAPGTGVYFQNLPSNPSLNSDCEISELRDLFTLATVACTVEASSRHRQVLKKRRTPRKVLWINESTHISKGRRGFPAAGADEGAKKERIENRTSGLLYSPPWLGEKSVPQDSSLFPSNLTSANIRNHTNAPVILKFGSQHSSRIVGGKIMASCQPPKSLRIKFTKVSRGNNRLLSVLASSKQPGAHRLPGKDSRVQGIAQRILQFVGGRSTTEKLIRAALGNNPDTSKALRLLLKQHKVYRVGDGGRGKAFLYVATPVGLSELEQLKDDAKTDDDYSVTRDRLNQYQDGQVSALKDGVPPTSNVFDLQEAAPLYTRTDMNPALPKATVSESVLQVVLGKIKE